jgi:hypothetical protein
VGEAVCPPELFPPELVIPPETGVCPPLPPVETALLPALAPPFELWVVPPEFPVAWPAESLEQAAATSVPENRTVKMAPVLFMDVSF